jgi:hypothetical protein
LAENIWQVSGEVSIPTLPSTAHWTGDKLTGLLDFKKTLSEVLENIIILTSEQVESVVR